jgi:hypothetical protein
MKTIPRLKFNQLTKEQQLDCEGRAYRAGFTRPEIKNTVYYKVENGRVTAFSKDIKTDAVK